MDAGHAHKHLDDLHSTLMWLRTLTPDNPRYKVWLGDLVEFVRAVFGLGSPEMAAVRDAIPDPPALLDADDSARYLARLDRFGPVFRSISAAIEQLPPAAHP